MKAGSSLSRFFKPHPQESLPGCEGPTTGQLYALSYHSGPQVKTQALLGDPEDGCPIRVRNDI